MNYAYFPVLVEDNYIMSRDELYVHLKHSNIYTRKYFYPLTSDQACFKNKYKKVDLENARELSRKVLVLPIYEDLDRKDACNIVEVIKY